MQLSPGVNSLSFVHLPETSPARPKSPVGRPKVPGLCEAECDGFKHWPENV